MTLTEKLAEVVGGANVRDDAMTLESCREDLSGAGARPACVVTVHAADEVERLVRLANETKTPLVPVSSGPPHARGDTVPSIGGAVIVDLSEMTKIMTVDRARRVAMVEPGVTFGELGLAAKQQGIRLNMPLLPRKTKSVVGSMLEREPVTMPKYQWDASDPLGCIEVVFGNGEFFRTGQAAGPGTIEEQWAVGAMQKAPYGPGVTSWHRLVQGAQGTMGIVTWASLRCELLPAVEESFLVGSPDLGRLLELMSWLVRLGVANECFLLDATDFASLFTPWQHAHEDVRASLPAWNLFFCVAGYEFFPEERVAASVKDIGIMAQRLGLEMRKAAGGIAAESILDAVQRPSDEPYWKLRAKGSYQDVLFQAPTGKLSALIDAMRTLTAAHGFDVADVGTYVQPVVQGTSCHCEFTVSYDPHVAVERARVAALNEEAFRTLSRHGAFFSRPYGPIAAAVMNRDSATVDVLRRLKKIFDPNGVMNPGKLCF